MTADPRRLRSDLLLFLAAVIWGFAFVAQRLGMEHVAPFTFNAARFLIGALVLIPFMLTVDRQRAATGTSTVSLSDPMLLRGGLLAGTVLFAAATLQQMGIVYTTAGKAGFITGLYVVLVPLFGLALGHHTGIWTWFGAILAAVGLYFLTVQGTLRMAWGDLLVLAGAFLWAVHVLLLGHLSPRTDPVKLAFLQFMTCAILSGAAALLIETVSVGGLRDALAPILYTGILSVGVGYTLQIIGQRHTRPADAAIFLSLETVFAVIGGRMLLGEQLGPRGLLGCALMLTGILVSQLLGQPEDVAAEISH